MRISTKILPLVLERELYERIERDALEQERDAVQQCRFLIKRALSETADDRSADLITSSPDPQSAA